MGADLFLETQFRREQPITKVYVITEVTKQGYFEPLVFKKRKDAEQKLQELVEADRKRITEFIESGNDTWHFFPFIYRLWDLDVK